MPPECCPDYSVMLSGCSRNRCPDVAEIRNFFLHHYIDLIVIYIPMVISKYEIQLATGQSKEEILKAFSLRSQEILPEGFIDASYKEFAKKYSKIFEKTEWVWQMANAFRS